MAMTALPAAPARSDPPATFVTKADAFLAALPNFVTEANALQTDVSSKQTLAATSAANALASANTASAAATAAAAVSGYFATTTASLSVATGSTGAMTIQTGKSFAVNDRVVLVRQSDPTKRMYGAVTAASSGSLTVLRDEVQPASGGGGPYTDWMIFHVALESLPIATASDVWQATSGHAVITPAAFAGAQAFQTLTDAASIAWDHKAGFNFTVTLGGNRTLAFPSNPKIQGGVIEIVQDATGSRTLGISSGMKREGGAPTLSTAAGAKDYIVYQMITTTLMIYSFIKAPS